MGKQLAALWARGYRFAVRARGWVVAAAAFAVTAVVLGAPADVQRGLTWLQAQVQPDGLLVGQPSAGAQQLAQCEVAATLVRLAGSSASISALLASLEAQSGKAATESVACWQALRLQRGDAVTGTELASRRVASQGLGAYRGYAATSAIDTGMALAVQLQQLSAGEKQQFLQWLQSVQQSDGSFLSAGKPDLLATAAIVRSLKEEASTSATAAALATNGASWLLTQRNPSGNWLGDVAVTALVYEAVHPYTAADAGIAAAVETFLLANQAADGSWSADAYTTAVALRALALTAAAPLDPTRAVLLVRFVDARTATGVPGVQLQSVDLAASGQSDDSGSVRLAGLAPGNYAFAATKAGYATVNLSITLAAGELQDLGVVQLIAPASSTSAVISGVVREQGSNRPLAGAGVQLEGHALSATSDAEGAYLVAGVPAGTVTVTVRKPGYLAASTKALAPAGQVLNFSPRLTPDFGDVSGCKLRGIILDAVTKQPLQGVAVSTTGAATVNTTTDASGRYVTPDVVTGFIRVTAVKTGYDGVGAGVQVACNVLAPTAVDFSPQLYATSQSPPFANAAAVAGVVLNAATNAPIAAAQLTLTPEGGAARSAQSAADGTFLFRGIDAASAKLQVQAAGYDAFSATYLLAPLQTLDLGQVRMRAPKVQQMLADLKVLQVKRTTASTEPQTLVLSGGLDVVVANLGTVPAPGALALTAFEDTNRNNRFDPALDVVLGTGTMAQSLPAGATASAAVQVQGVLSFRDSPIHVVIDAGDTVAESNKANNVGSTAASALMTPAATFVPAQKWHWLPSDTLPNPEYNRVMMSPVVGRLVDTNGDGVINGKDSPVVAFTTWRDTLYDRAGVVRVVHGATGKEIFQTQLADNVVGTSNLAIADLDSDGKPEIVAITVDNRLIAFKNDGTRKWAAPTVPFADLSTSPSASAWGAPAIADLDGDGSPEIVMGRTVFNKDGTFNWRGKGDWGGANANQEGVSAPVVADLFGTGHQNVILGGSVYTAGGDLLWQKMNGFAAVADFEGKGEPSIVVAGGVGGWRLALFSRDGVEKWNFTVPNGFGAGPPTIADVDQDGIPEIGVASGGFYTVFRADGTVLWSKAISDTSSAITGSTFFDFDGDGTPEALYGDERHIRAYRGTDGFELWSELNSNATTIEYPVVADIDSDGHADMIVVANPNNSVSNNRGVRAYQDTNNAWVGVRSVWNQHAYSIDNINDDLTVPRSPTPSWKTHNTFRLNKRVDGDPRGLPDLTVGYMRVIDGGSVGSRLIVRVGNGGAVPTPEATSLAVYSSNPALGTPTAAALVGTAAVGSLKSGEWRDVAVEVPRSLASLNALGQVWIVGDDDGAGKRAMEDFDRSNNTLQGDLPSAAANLSVAVTTDKPVYTETDIAIFTGTMANLGSFAREAAVRLTMIDAAGQVVEALPQIASRSVPASGSVAVAAPWSAAGTLGGNYVLRAEAVAPSGLIYAASTASFVVAPSQPLLASARVTTDRAAYTAAQTIQLSSRVANVAANALLENLQVRTEIRSAGGQSVFGKTEVIEQLAAANSKQFGYAVGASSLPAGTYTASVQLLSAQGIVQAQGATGFTVLGGDQSGVGLTGMLQATPSIALIGQPTRFAVQVSNASGANLSNLALILRVVDPASGALVASLPATIPSLAAGQTGNAAFDWVTTGSHGQTLVATLVAQLAAGETRLAQVNLPILGVPALASEPAQLTFAPIYLGESATQTLTLTSSGTAPANSLTFSLAGSSASQFRVPAGGCTSASSMPVGGTCTLTVSYVPETTGTHTGEVRIGFAGVETLVVPLAGQARPVVFSGTLGTDASEFEVGANINLHYSVSNPATVTSQLAGSLTVNSAASQLATWPLNVSVPGNLSQAATQPYLATEAGTMVATLSQQLASETKVLATTTFTVVDPAVPLAVSSGRKAHARILVLLSCPVGNSGNDDAACAAQRSQGISAYLVALGIPHKITTTARAFTDDLRCGAYNTYWISGGAAKLDQQVIAEVREAVTRGEALWVDGVHDSRNQLLHDPLGVKQQGTLPQANQGAVLVDPGLYGAGSVATLGTPTRFELAAASAQAQALFTQVPGNQAPAPAIVSNAYGAGRTLLFAFDLAATIGADPAQASTALRGLVATSASHAASGAPALTVGDLAVLSTSIGNLGTRTVSLRVDATLPAGLTSTFATSQPQLTVNMDGSTQAVWTVTLPAGATQELAWQVRALQAGNYNVPFAVFTLPRPGSTLPPKLTDNTAIAIEVRDATSLLAEASAAVQALQPTANSDKNKLLKALESVGDARTLHNAGKYEQALVQWVAASDALASIGSAETAAARRAVAMAMEATSDALCVQRCGSASCQ